jgi:transcriptional regulator with XRE-family HTH domain
MDDDGMAAEARRLRTEEQLSARQIQERLGVTKVRLIDWLRGIPAPEWTTRPNAKDGLRARATQLRASGWSVNDIALELGVAKSTAFQWVRHLPLDRDSERARKKAEHSKLMTDAQWAAYRAARDARRATRCCPCRDVVGYRPAQRP